MMKMTGHNAVNHPSHYKGSKGLEVTEFTVSLFNGEGKETSRTTFFDKESAKAFAREHGGVVSYR